MGDGDGEVDGVAVFVTTSLGLNPIPPLRPHMADDQTTTGEYEEYEVEEGSPHKVDEGEYVVEGEDEGSGWTKYLDEGAIAVLLVVGVGLFLFPEPATSALGILLIAAGVGGWIIDLLN